MADIEESKRKAARRAVKDHFDPSLRFIGIGSGTTIKYVVEAIKEAGDTSRICFIPTGYQSRQEIQRVGLVPIALDALPTGSMIDVAFDGADEVDDELNCVKGGGACLTQEKLVATNAKKFICVADYRKLQPRLLSHWPTIPIEVMPLAVPTVQRALRALGSSNPALREGFVTKAGPIKTDQDFYIIDAPFPRLLTSADVNNGQDGSGKGGQWEVSRLAQQIKQIYGVLEVGLFTGKNGYEVAAAGEVGGGQKPVAAYFGMEDGDVVVRDGKSR
ncbi:MAG: ribose-5-phosphate isomerase rki1 [Candelina mexicana]|nr:MAG: ribose-5-phosphate isomerase rki1 [Candelina mexicana]